MRAKEQRVISGHLECMQYGNGIEGIPVGRAEETIVELCKPLHLPAAIVQSANPALDTEHSAGQVRLTSGMLSPLGHNVPRLKLVVEISDIKSASSLPTVCGQLAGRLRRLVAHLHLGVPGDVEVTVRAEGKASSLVFRTLDGQVVSRDGHNAHRLPARVEALS